MANAPATLTQREEQILQAVYRYRYLTLLQVTRLFFSVHSRNYAGACLKRLTEEQWLTRFCLPSTQKGNHTFVYQLGKRGRKHLASLGFDLTAHPASTTPPPSYQHLRHSLLVNDVLIAATVLPTLEPQIELHDLQTEWLLKKSFPRFSATQIDGQNKPPAITVIPDGWLTFRLLVGGQKVQVSTWVEIDCGTEEQKQFQRKVHGLYTIATSALLKEALGVKEVTFAIATSAGEKRHHQLLHWCEQELRRLHATQDADLFLFTLLPRESIDPVQLFLSPVWLLPFGQGAVPLVDVSEG